jgi:gas vesicle protein
VRQAIVGGSLFKERAMENQYAKNVFLGVMIGGLAGLATIFLFAAQSAKLARAKIRRQSIRWIGRAAGIANHSIVRGRRTAGNMTVHIS